MHNSVSINLNVLDQQQKLNDLVGVNQTKIFYSGFCMYPEHNQLDPDNPDCREESAYQQTLTQSTDGKNSSLSVSTLLTIVTTAFLLGLLRYHNIFGPEGTWDGGREKSPAAICRKVAYLPDVGGAIEVWGDGQQTRSFLYIDECIEATRRLMDSDFIGPVNIGSEEMVRINDLVEITIQGCW